MAGNSSSKPATVADLKRLVNAATASKQPKRNRQKAKSNSRGSTTATTAIGTTVESRGPSQVGLANGSVRISNSEFVTDLSTGGSILSWDMNPNSGSLFTWLSRVAIGYELFRFTKITFRYTPICASTTTGVVVMAPDYDASDAAPTTKQAMSAYSGSVRGNVWNKLSCDVKPPKGWYYVGNSSGNINPTNTDIKFYDMAKFYLGLFNATGTTAVGELVVDYVCEFSKPDFGPPPSPAESVSISAPTLANPIAGTVTYTGNLPVAVSQIGSGALAFTFNTSGTFMIISRSNLVASAAPGTCWGMTISAPGATSSTIVNWIDYVSAYTSAGATFPMLQYVVIDAVIGTVLTFSTAAAITGLSFLSYKITSTNRQAAITV